ncbi:MAG TPA: BatD family protein [Patescibacteria group bacterium]|nr:BatD family protein [Patescibacteria group bacterium]
MKRTGSACFFFFLALLLAASTLLANVDAEVTATISAEKLGLDDTLIYTLTFKNIENPSQPDLTYLDDFKTLQTSRSSEFQFRNGASSTSTRFVYYLMPVRTGKLTLPPVRYQYQGQDYQTRQFTVEVVKGSLNPAQPPQAGQPSFFDDNFFTSPAQNRQPQKVDAYLRAVLSKKNCLKGEQLLFRVLLYTRNRIQAVNMLSSASFAGFWQEWFPVPQSITPGSENVDGVIYQVYEIRKAALFASESGTLTIPSLQFELEMADPQSMFFASQPIRRSTQEVKITVGEPPPAAAGLPVGQFDFSLHSPQAQADINDIVTLKMEISGSGNCKAIIPPALPGSDQFVVYPAKITQENTYNSAALAGTLRAEIPVSFNKTGTLTFPPLEFRYFDPARGSIVSLRSRPLPIRVSGEKLSADRSQTLPRSAIVQKGEDIDFIRSGRLHDQSWHLYRQKWYAAVILAFFAFNLLLLLKTVLWDRHIAASPLLRNRQVLARTLKRLARVRHGEDIAPLLEAYFQEKSGLGLAAISSQKIAEIFRQRQVAAASAEKFLFIKSQSELAKFSEHKKSALELKKDLETLRGLLREIDKKMK